jgi:3-dehydroquinate dehydratase-2
MKILIINGPNLGTLGRREPEIYGHLTLADIEQRLREKASELGVEVSFFQSNHEGAIIDYLEAEAASADGIIINGGALTHYGLSLRDALEWCNRPVVEVHISNIHARESFRHRSVISAVARGVIVGMGWRGYILALEGLVDGLQEEKREQSQQKLSLE